MLKSMTGYGSSNVETADFVLSLELKSVNHRFMKVAGRVSDEFSFLQMQLEESIRKRLDRGAVYYTAVVEPTRTEDLYDIDLSVLNKYMNTLKDPPKSLEMATSNPQLKDLLLLPGVVCVHETLKLSRNGGTKGINRKELLEAVQSATDQALSELVNMRQKEGTFLAGEFNKRCDHMQQLLREITGKATEAITEYNKRLLDRVNQLVSESDVNVSPEDLIREVAIIAERSDITEELARMESHLQQFIDATKQPQAVGRKLEFIVQEMFRESNTMGAKISNAALSRSIVDLKAEVDRLKEQVLNIE